MKNIKKMNFTVSPNSKGQHRSRIKSHVVTVSYLSLAWLKLIVPQYITNQDRSLLSLLHASTSYLVFVVVELVAVAGLEHFETVRAQKIACVLVELTEMKYYIVVERRTEIANLHNKIPLVTFLRECQRFILVTLWS